MQTDQIITFLEIAQSGSFRAASRRLHLSQSTISARIALLEQRLGVELFDRSRREITLSEAGRQFLEPAHAVIHALEQAETAVSDPATLARTFRIGAVEIIALSWLPRLIDAIVATYPSVSLDVVVRTTTELIALLEADDVDLILVPETRPEPQPASRRLGHAVWSLATAKRRYPRLRIWSPSDLADERIAVLGSGSLIGPALRDWFRVAGIRPASIITCDSVSVLAAVIRSGTAVGVLPRELGTTADDPVVFHDLAPPLPRFRYNVEKRRSPDSLADAIAEMAKDCSSFSNDEGLL